MKALSLWQPWASLWACGRKEYETRGWRVAMQAAGAVPIAVHAAKTMASEIHRELRDILDARFGKNWWRELPRGCLIGCGELVECVATEARRPAIGADELQQGNWAPGRFAFRLAQARLFAEPVPWRGAQGLFEVPDAVIAAALTAAPAGGLTPIGAG